MTTAVTEGGFDPVPVTAAAGDTLDIEVQVSGSTSPVAFNYIVPALARPIVVRTDPPPRKRDVPLNANLVIVFSEPVDGRSLTASSVQLLRGATPVAGTVSLLQGVTAAVVFDPSEPLDANTDYRLVVTEGVKDLDGDPLSGPIVVEFTSGMTFVMRVDSVSVLPDSTALVVGSQVQLATLLLAMPDTNGFMFPIVGQPLAWSSDNPAVATVSHTGLVTALGQGEAHIRAEVVQEGGGVFGTAVVLVAASLAPVDSV
ncbi:MAG: Ig-like domain-containing protein, partial [bacterium]